MIWPVIIFKSPDDEKMKVMATAMRVSQVRLGQKQESMSKVTSRSPGRWESLLPVSKHGDSANRY